MSEVALDLESTKASSLAVRPTYSVVVPLFNEEDNVEPLVTRVAAVMDGLGEPYEIVFVDDGSRDGTFARLAAVARERPNVKIVRFARNYGQEAAVEAAYLNATGDWFIQMDGDLQNPPEEIPKLLAKRDEGFDVVFGVRGERTDPLPRVAASWGMQWAMGRMGIELPEDVSTFRVMRAPVARLVAALPERKKFFSALLVWSGARIGAVRVKHAPRTRGATKYDFTKLLNHTFDLVVGFSSKPLRWIGVVGVGFAALGFALGAWTIFRKVVLGYGVVGWTSLFAAIVVLSGAQLVALSVIGEYIARIYVQAQGRPLYNVAERVNFDGHGHDGPRLEDAGRAPSDRDSKTRLGSGWTT
jgi:glycosyltransferase involved in cell wall biosynthesis